MVGFDEWLSNIRKEYPLYQDKDGYSIGNIRALKVGWKAALEWLYVEMTGYDSTQVRDMINEELEEK